MLKRTLVTNSKKTTKDLLLPKSMSAECKLIVTKNRIQDFPLWQSELWIWLQQPGLLWRCRFDPCPDGWVKGYGVAAAAAQVSAAAWIQSLAQKCPYATSVAIKLKKKKKPTEHYYLEIYSAEPEIYCCMLWFGTINKLVGLLGFFALINTIKHLTCFLQI